MPSEIEAPCLWIHAEQDLRGFLADYLISSPSFISIVKFDRGEMEEKRIGVIVFLGIVESSSHVPDPGKKLILHLYSANTRNPGKGSVAINSSAWASPMCCTHDDKYDWFCS
ncbi:MAG: hypothetical protein CL912_11890 [Deltaproteobacteria bacterium]|nr:hypothetical protein [Deltaproteobacteria bacterium]